MKEAISHYQKLEFSFSRQRKKTFTLAGIGLVLLLCSFLSSTVLILNTTEDLYKDTLTKATEHTNFDLVQLIANDFTNELQYLHHQSVNPLLQLNALPSGRDGYIQAIAYVDNLVRTLLRGTHAKKIKIYNERGYTIYSTDHRQIGDNYIDQQGVISGLRGEKYSNLIFRPDFYGIEGRATNLDLVQSYIPFREPSSGSSIWVFEVYSDVTQEIADAKRSHQEMAFWVVGFMFLLFLLVLGLTYFCLNRIVLNHRLQLATQEKKIEQQRALNADISHFVATAAHELRSPMTGILGYAELISERDFDAAYTKDIAKVILDQSRCMTNILDDLLDLSFLDQQSLPNLTIVSLEIGQVLEEVLSRFKAPGSENRLITNVDPGVGRVALDLRRASQAIANILSNAFKYSFPETNVRLSVLRDASYQVERVGFRVSDQGRGMTPEELKNVFKVFWRSESVSELPGSGIGMSLVKRIMDHHGGSVDIQSSPNVGTECTLWFAAASVCAGR